MWAFIIIFILIVFTLVSRDIIEGKGFYDLARRTGESISLTLIVFLSVFLFTLMLTGNSKEVINEYKIDNTYKNIQIEGDEFLVFEELDFVVPAEEAIVYFTHEKKYDKNILIEENTIINKNIFSKIVGLDGKTVKTTYRLYINK